MNPLKSITSAIFSGFMLALVLMFVLGSTGTINLWGFWVWMHVMVGIAWVGLLYYFNFIQMPGIAIALSEVDSGGPGPAAIHKYITPLALLWFRWAALATWLTGAMALEAMHGGTGSGVVAAFTFTEGFRAIGMGAWLGTIMMFNVWVLIWPSQRKILGLDGQTHDAEVITRASKVALMASRTNVLLSIPMLFGMTAQAHGMLF